MGVTVYEELQLFSGVMNQIRANDMDSVRYHELMRAAIDFAVADSLAATLPAVQVERISLARASFSRLEPLLGARLQ